MLAVGVFACGASGINWCAFRLHILKADYSYYYTKSLPMNTYTWMTLILILDNTYPFACDALPQ